MFQKQKASEFYSIERATGSWRWPQKEELSMLHHLYANLKKLDLTYHKLARRTEKGIVLIATSLKSERVEEVMRIKSLADRYSLFTKWDGTNITIQSV
jgi:hypothetical protein